jgi:hypothetical protein
VGTQALGTGMGELTWVIPTGLGKDGPRRGGPGTRGGVIDHAAGHGWAGLYTL